MITTHDPIIELLEVIGWQEKPIELPADTDYSAAPRYLRDVKLNLKSTLKSEYLSEQESMLLALSLAANTGKTLLIAGFRRKSLEAGASPEQLSEAMACASLMSSNNVFYRFRHYMQCEKYNNLPAKFRMSIMINPVNGKQLFELMSLAVSAVNGCEMCVRSHEQSLKEMGCSEKRIFEAIRLASVIESLNKIF